MSTQNINIKIKISKKNVNDIIGKICFFKLKINSIFKQKNKNILVRILRHLIFFFLKKPPPQFFFYNLRILMSYKNQLHVYIFIHPKEIQDN